jgi:hypothetical protein
MADTLSSPEGHSAPVIPAYITHDVSLILDRYPNIGKQITQLWGSVDLNVYLNSLVFDERGSRHGFAEPIASALFRVYEAHRTLVPTKSRGDIWDAILGQIK